MRNATERIEVRKFYLGKVIAFGLLYGLILGLIFGVVLFIVIMMGGELPSIGVEPISGGVGVAFVALLVGAVGVSILLGLLAVIGALLYNMVAGMGGMIHIGLAENMMKRLPNQSPSLPKI